MLKQVVYSASKGLSANEYRNSLLVICIHVKGKFIPVLN
jgi:hypothetical protein